MLGPLNSPHFRGTSRAYYGHYHSMALTRMAQCDGMRQALAAFVSEEDIARSDTEWHECEREAFVFEMFAQHYLQDAWSTGHMWKRWGFPSLDKFPSRLTHKKVDPNNPINTVDVVDASDLDWNKENTPARRLIIAGVTAAYTGMIHGAKAVIATEVDNALKGLDAKQRGLRASLIQALQDHGYFLNESDIPLLFPARAPNDWTFSDDPLSGPLYDIPWDSLGTPVAKSPTRHVEWRSGNDRHSGVGDEFWNPDPQWQKVQLAIDPAYSDQRQRLLGCAASSLRKVYEAGGVDPVTGTRGHGNLSDPINVEGMDIRDIDPMSDFCWGQWATNDSMLGALGPVYLTRDWQRLLDLKPGILDLIANTLATAKFVRIVSPSSDPVVVETCDLTDIPCLDRRNAALALDAIRAQGDQMGAADRQSFGRAVIGRSVVDARKIAIHFAANALADGTATTSANLKTQSGDDLSFLGVAPSAPPPEFPDELDPRVGKDSDLYVRHMFWRAHLSDVCQSPAAVIALRDRCVAGAATGGDPEACTACEDAAQAFVPLCTDLVNPQFSSKCSALGFSAHDGLPENWYAGDQLWRAPLGACLSPSMVAARYCSDMTDALPLDSESSPSVYDVALVKTLSSSPLESSCFDPVLGPDYPEHYPASSRVRVSLHRREGDPWQPRPLGLVDVFEIDLKQEEFVIADNTCKALGSTSSDAVVLKNAGGVGLWSDPGRGNERLAGFPWATAQMATCGWKQRQYIWNRSCADILQLVPIGTGLTQDVVGGVGAAPGFDITEDGVTLPSEEERCIVTPLPQFDPTCPLGTTCSPSGICVGTARPWGAPSRSPVVTFFDRRY